MITEGLHDAHVAAYIMLELDWDSATVDPSLPQPPKDNPVWAEELWEV